MSGMCSTPSTHQGFFFFLCQAVSVAQSSSVQSLVVEQLSHGVSIHYGISTRNYIQFLQLVFCESHEFYNNPMLQLHVLKTIKQNTESASAANRKTKLLQKD